LTHFHHSFHDLWLSLLQTSNMPIYSSNWHSGHLLGGDGKVQLSATFVEHYRSMTSWFCGFRKGPISTRPETMIQGLRTPRARSRHSLPSR